MPEYSLSVVKLRLRFTRRQRGEKEVFFQPKAFDDCFSSLVVVVVVVVVLVVVVVFVIVIVIVVVVDVVVLVLVVVFVGVAAAVVVVTGEKRHVRKPLVTSKNNPTLRK